MSLINPADRSSPAHWFGPGLIAAGLIAFIAQAAAPLTHMPAPLLAVALGLALGAANLGPMLAPGLGLWSKPGLQLGVALMGAQITFAEMAALGAPALVAGGAIVLAGVAAGSGLGVLLGLPLAEAAIAACAVSICGASAALAAAQTAPSTPQIQRTTAFVVVGVNILSTAAMLLYPLLAHAMGFSAHQAGVFFGLSIHDVAQVAGAGQSVSPEAADAAALSKLARILWLGPAVVLVGIILARFAAAPAGERPALKAPPLFVWGFAALILARGLHLLPQPLVEAMAATSRILLLGGVAAISAQIGPKALLGVQPKLAAALVGTTILVGGAALLAAALLIV
ncbi:YeiH family protein [Caulobacter sp. NIBR2454]|uniref:YeiH family protein n=1 Tax=Caulobacter sp. NIBR2454 TaxID=3015996 RepID=UPI0022B6A5F2|nr:putative sulfate exporter family transporter [Caulobacter sp. NIBR2454]